jgi:hypothetical protein
LAASGYFCRVRSVGFIEKNQKEGEDGMKNTVTASLRFILHPISEIETAVTRRKAMLWVSVGLILLLFISSIVQTQYTGRNFTFQKPGTLNVFFLFTGTVLLFALFTVSNWCVTTLTEGKGKYRDIWVAGALCFQPMIYMSFAGTALSHILSRTEGVMLQWVSATGMIWTFLLLLVSFMALHQHSLIKTLVIFLLTLFAMLVILFFIMMFLTLMQHLYSFFMTVYTELRFRPQAGG